jgi:multiple sugar transport system permease protein
MAFQDYRFLVPESTGLFSSFTGLDNFREMLGDPKFWHSFGVSLKFTAMLLPADLFLALIVTILLSHLGDSFIVPVHRVIVYLPVVLPIAAAMLVWQQLYNEQFGYLNVLLSKLFGHAAKIRWLGSIEWALRSAVIASLWKGFGYNTMLFLIGIYNINRELYEAAAIDGAGPLRQVVSITIPLLRPIITLVLVLSVGIFSATDR